MDDPIRAALEARFREACRWSETQAVEDHEPLTGAALDSLAFAKMVVQLEMDLGYDPFLISEKPVYPRTFGELLAFYQTHASSTEP